MPTCPVLTFTMGGSCRLWPVQVYSVGPRSKHFTFYCSICSKTALKIGIILKRCSDSRFIYSSGLHIAHGKFKSRVFHVRMAGAEHVEHEFVLLFLLSAKCLIELKAYFSIQFSF